MTKENGTTDYIDKLFTKGKGNDVIIIKTFAMLKKNNEIFAAYLAGEEVPAIINYTGNDAPAFIRKYYKEAEDEVRQFQKECLFSSKYSQHTQEETEKLETEFIQTVDDMINLLRGLCDSSIERVMVLKKLN